MLSVEENYKRLEEVWHGVYPGKQIPQYEIEYRHMTFRDTAKQSQEAMKLGKMKEGKFVVKGALPGKGEGSIPGAMTIVVNGKPETFVLTTGAYTVDTN